MQETSISAARSSESVRRLVEANAGGAGEHEPRIHFVALHDDGVVSVRIDGCGGCCPASALPWVEALEATLKREVPGVRLVEVVP